jgi:hypothetical protein
VSLARTALEHGVNANLLRKWVLKQTGMRAPKERKLIVSPSPQVPLLEVHTQAAAPIRPVLQTTGHLELVVPGRHDSHHGSRRCASADDCTALPRGPSMIALPAGTKVWLAAAYCVYDGNIQP